MLAKQATADDGRIAVEHNNLAHNRETIERIKRDMEAATATEQHLEEQIDAAQKEIESIDAEIKGCQAQLLELLDSTGKSGKHVTFNKEARERFLAFALDSDNHWPGNFRDLNAMVVRMATLSDGGRPRC